MNTMAEDGLEIAVKSLAVIADVLANPLTQNQSDRAVQAANLARCASVAARHVADSSLSEWGLQAASMAESLVASMDSVVAYMQIQT